jgi:hypothetical protein
MALDNVLHASGAITALYEDVVHERRQSRLLGHTVVGEALNVEVEGDEAGWICDVTVPDGSIFRPGEPFVKIWRVQNSGTVPWLGRYLMRVGAPAGYGIVSSPRLSPIPNTLPGEIVDMSVSCTTQQHAGSSEATFKMSDEHGNLYFPNRYSVGLMLSITVVEV